MSMSNVGRTSQSPAALLGGASSSTPTAPQAPTQQQELPQHEGLGLRQRPPAQQPSAEMAARVSLPQTAARSSLVQTAVSIVKDTAMPTLSAIGNVVKTGQKAIQQFSQPSVSSQPLQNALRAELNPDNMAPGNREQADANQLNAHREAVAYGKGSAQMMDRVLPFATSVLRVGLGGTSPAFGVGRNSGLAAGDAAARAEQGRAQSGAVFDNSAAGAAASAPSAAPAKPASLGSTVFSTVAQWVAGSVAGAAGNLVGQTMVAPIVNLMPRQFAPIDDKAVVPDQIVNNMNALVPGSGTELRAAVKAQQTEISNIGSASNITIGQVVFDSITATRAAALGTTPLGAAGQVGFGLAASASAGGVIGAAMSVRQSVATIKVPNPEELAAQVAQGGADGAQRLQALIRNGQEVPLFYAKHMNAAAQPAATPLAQERDLEAGPRSSAGDVPSASAMRAALANVGQVASVAGKVVTAPLNAVVSSFQAGPLMDPQPSNPAVERRSDASLAGHTLQNIGASLLNRTKAMAESTAALSLISTATAAVAKPLAEGDQRAAMAIGSAIGIHTAIKPWFTALAKDIPEGDAKIKANRQEAVDASVHSPLSATSS